MESDSIIGLTRDLLVKYIKEHVDESKNEWCSRENWWIVVNHTFRVEHYAAQMMKTYEHLEEEERLTLQIGAVLHDIGKVVQNQDHASISAQIVSKIFYDTPFLKNSGIDFDRLNKIILVHSDKKDENDNDILSIILKDSDILDEIGAMSILMQSSKHEFYTADFYEKIIQTINEKEIPFCEKQYNLLRTNTAKNIMDKKMDFIKNFKTQLEYEILG